MSAPLWWSLYFIFSLWAQELTGGLDFLAPGVLICLQTHRLGLAFWLTLLFALVQEGTGNFEFGVTIIFYLGLYLAFYLTRWLIDPENPLFILLYSIILALWSWVIINGAASFQELNLALPSPWLWLPKQGIAYILHWSIALALFRRWVRHERL